MYIDHKNTWTTAYLHYSDGLLSQQLGHLWGNYVPIFITLLLQIRVPSTLRRLILDHIPHVIIINHSGLSFYH